MASAPIDEPRHLGDTDDDDVDYELASEESTPYSIEIDEEYDEDEDDDDDDDDEIEEGMPVYFDAEEGTFQDGNGLEVTLETIAESLTQESEDSAADGSETPRATSRQHESGATTITPHELLQFFARAGFRGIFSNQPRSAMTRAQARRFNARASYMVEDDDDGAGQDERMRAREARARARYPRIPSEAGAKLMQDGTFGTNDRCDHTACGLPYSQTTMRKRRKLARRMLDRELGLSGQSLSQRPRTLGALTTQDLLPATKPDLLINMAERCYSGQFSEDGSFFFACGQDFRVRMYDTSNPYDWKYYKTAQMYGGQWTITDASLSPDNKLLAYSSIQPQICLANTDQSDTTEPRMVDFSNSTAGLRSHPSSHFGIWSLRFSGDGSEIVGGTSDMSVYVYDLEANRTILRIPGHADHVNAVCYGDKMSPHILYSGSDDTTLKVWDRRSLASMRPAGMFLGHTEGLTYIDSKGDGRYVISNGKDQTCKLWDLRKMISTDEGERIDIQDYTTNFDYRFSPYEFADYRPHPHDCSVTTFHGHRVLKTLIRCHFSPQGSTDGRYIYSGSHDGRVFIWNLDGTLASKIDVNEASSNSRASTGRSRERYDYDDGEWNTIVRDCSWHPSAPIVAATAWNGWDHGQGTLAVFSWNDGVDDDELAPGTAEEMGSAHAKASSLGSAPMGARVTPQLNYDDRFYHNVPLTRARHRNAMLRSRVGLGALFRNDDDDPDYVDDESDL